MTEEHVRAIFLLAGISIVSLTKIPNQYWGDDTMNEKSPWWNVETEYGIITIGWRKHVINIDWEKTNHILDVTKDNVTKNGYLVHAWGYNKAVEYLSIIGYLIIQKINRAEYQTNG